MSAAATTTAAATLPTQVVAEATQLRLAWDDGATSTYPWLWLRDHAADPATLHPVTQQRQLHTASLDPGLAAAHAEVVGEGAQLAVRITWHGGEPASDVPVGFLRRFRTPTSGAASTDWRPAPPLLWDAAALGEAPATPYAEIMGTDAGLARWLAQVARHGFAIASGTPATAEATEELVRRVSYVRHTIFGGFWQFTADLTKADTAYTDLELLPHTDGTYSHDAPGLQLLHCLHFEGTGGESSIVDGFRVAAELAAADPEHHRLLSSVDIPGQYIGDGSHLMAARPVLRHDASGRLVQVSYNNADRAPFLLPGEQMVELYAALRAFDELTNDRRLQWRHVLQPGEAMLFDNWRVLHGRGAYRGQRTMCGAYLNHEDFESRLRTLPAAGGDGCEG